MGSRIESSGWKRKSPTTGIARCCACTAIGHGRTLSAAAAAIVNGTAIHGEDFDDTFEGGPIHTGAVIVPKLIRSSTVNGSAANFLIVRREPSRATGGTTAGTVELLAKLGAQVISLAFLVELTGLGGRNRLPGQDVFALLYY